MAADPWKAWARNLYQKGIDERHKVTKAYERLFDATVRYVDFVQRNTLNKFCAWEVPADPMVDRTLCRDYIIRRLAKLGLAVQVANPQQAPFKLLISWLDPSPPPPMIPVPQSIAIEIPARRHEEEEDSIGSEPEPDPPDDEDGDGDGDGASSSKKRSSSKRKLFTYYRKIANPSKIIGE